MFTDIVGFSRQMGSNEARMLRLLEIHNQVVRQAVAEHHGHVIKTMGDGFLVEFSSVVNAVQCAQQVQARFRAYNAQKGKDEQIHVRIGIHLGDIIQQNGDVLGDGVNVASRLQAIAEPDTICLSYVVYREVEKKLALGTVVSLGRPKLKNIAQREPVYALLHQRPRGVRQRLQIQRLKLKQKRRALQVAALILVLGLVSVGTLILRNRYLPAPTPEQLKEGPLPASQATLPLPDKPSIVVLPFDNTSGDPQQDYFSNGITEVLTSDLSRISGLFVIARNTAFSIGKSRNVQEVGRELGVRYVLEGSVQKAGDQVRIVAQLIDTTTGGHLWSQRYDRPLTDIFALQDEIVQKIVTTLNLQLTLREQGVPVRKRTDYVEAYDTFLRGAEYFWRFTKEGNAQARPLFEKTIELDPQYAEAYVYLGWTYLSAFLHQWNPDLQTLQRALELEQQALALDDALPNVHSVLSAVYMYQGKYEPALAAAERAIALDPNDAESYVKLANIFNLFGERTAEAIELIEKAIRLNPRYPVVYPFQLGWAYSLVGRYEEAIAAQKQALLRNPNWLFSHVELFVNYRSQWSSQLSHDPQTLDRALEVAQRMVALDASSPWSRLISSAAHLWKKQYEQASVEAERVIALNPGQWMSYTGLAGILSFLGRPEEALELAERALRLNPRLPPRNPVPLGQMYYVAGRTEEAIATLKKSLNGSPADLDAHLVLAAVYSEVGRDTEAQAEAAEVLRINPNWSLEVWKERVPYKDPTMLERHLAALRQAGLK
jgi:adenylate cyclase